MKVAVVFYALAPEGGGVHTFQRSILEALRAAEPASEHEFVFYSAGGGGEPGVTAIPPGYVPTMRRRGIQVAREVFDRFQAPRRLGPTWFERSLDEQGVEFVWFAGTWAEDCDQPFLFTVFDLAHLLEPHFPEVRAGGEWERRHLHFGKFLPKASGVIAPNEAGKRQVERLFNVEPERIVCLPHPTPDFARRPDEFGDDSAVLEREGIRRPYLLYPAQFWAHKNHATLLDALALLDGYELVLVGSDKGQRSHVEGLARGAGVADRVHVLGFVETATLISLYRSAHALVYLSFFGPENLPPLEAFALGCPVIASDIPGAREQMGDAARLVPVLDAKAVADAVRALEDEGERERAIALGRERAAGLTAEGYVAGALEFIDRFAAVRRCWA
jgi:glycosyltransferase involved in cell wall biosynthesis